MMLMGGVDSDDNNEITVDNISLLPSVIRQRLIDMLQNM